MFGRRRPEPPTLEELRARPTTVTGWSAGDLRAALAYPEVGGSYPRRVVLLDHPLGCAVMPVEALDLVANGRMGVSESAPGFPTAFVSDSARIAPGSAAARAAAAAPAGSVVVLDAADGAPRLATSLTPDTLADLVTWAKAQDAAGPSR